MCWSIVVVAWLTYARGCVGRLVRVILLLERLDGDLIAVDALAVAPLLARALVDGQGEHGVVPMVVGRWLFHHNSPGSSFCTWAHALSS